MSVQNYLIDAPHIHWPNVLAGWTGLLPPRFTVWLVNRFGDLFLALPDDSIHVLDVAAGTLTRQADDQDEFCHKLDEGENASNWLMVPLVDRLVAADIRLQAGQCYSFLVPPTL